MKFNRADFPYSTSFKAVANIIVPKSEDKYLAKASLDSLGKLLDIPQDKIDNSPDLLYISADMWVGGMANKNDHAITKEDTVELAKQIPHKYLNLEHEEEQIVGALLNFGFREYTDDRNYIEVDKAAEYDKPIVASAGGFIWRSVHPNLANLLVEASEVGHANYGKASFSWEILFKEYDILVGSKFIDEGEVVSDPELKEKMKGSLKQNGGSGSYEGKRIYTLVKGPKLLLGAGIVASPAADVKGILTAETPKEEREEQKIAASQNEITLIDKCDLADGDYPAKRFSKHIEIGGKKYETTSTLRCGNTSKSINITISGGKIYQKSSPSDKKNKKTIKIISQKKHVNVNTINNIMKFKNLEDYKSALASVNNGDEIDAKTIAELQANFEPLFEKAVASAITDAIKVESEKYHAQLEEQKNATAKAAQEKAEIEKKFADLEEAKAALETQLNEVKVKLDNEAKARVYDERMGALDAEYDFEGEDELRTIVASEIKDLDDEAYAAWTNKFKVLAKEKSKKYKAEMKEKIKKEEEEKKAKASTDETPEAKDAREKAEAEEAIKLAKANAKSNTPNSPHEEKTSLAEQFAGLKLELQDSK